MAEQTEREHTYLCIDLKTFYASVECCDRGLDPFTTNLVVADPSRTEKTICLAVSPAMKALGVRNRCRVFEIPPHIDYIMARPRMQRYMERSADIYSIYLEFVSPEDIHPYSIDECFIDATPYLDLYGVSARAFASLLIDEVHRRTGISAAAGIGPNLFLAKVALDITAKHVRDNIGILDEESFRKQIWPHRPITDIWGIGPGIAARLAKYGVCDLMGVAALDEGNPLSRAGRECRVSHRPRFRARAGNHRRDPSLSTCRDLICQRAGPFARLYLRGGTARTQGDGRHVRPRAGGSRTGCKPYLAVRRLCGRTGGVRQC